MAAGSVFFLLGLGFDESPLVSVAIGVLAAAVVLALVERR